jgi:hypothetical protein
MKKAISKTLDFFMPKRIIRRHHERIIRQYHANCQRRYTNFRGIGWRREDDTYESSKREGVA